MEAHGGQQDGQLGAEDGGGEDEQAYGLLAADKGPARIRLGEEEGECQRS